MTRREKQVVSAYTGCLMCSVTELLEYIEELLGKPIYTHELANSKIVEEIKKRSKDEFIKICSGGEDDK